MTDPMLLVLGLVVGMAVGRVWGRNPVHAAWDAMRKERDYWRAEARCADYARACLENELDDMRKAKDSAK